MSMTVYREMPAIWDPAFRKSFYQRWGRESAIICARSLTSRPVVYEDLRIWSSDPSL
jgi:hypothetical protein